MSDVNLEKKYIVIAFSNTSGRVFKNLINCDAYSVEKFVKSQTFGEELFIGFYSIEKLNMTHTMDVGDFEKVVYMNNMKTFSKFLDELQDVMEELEIIEKDKEE